MSSHEQCTVCGKVGKLMVQGLVNTLISHTRVTPLHPISNVRGKLAKADHHKTLHSLQREHMGQTQTAAHHYTSNF